MAREKLNFPSRKKRKELLDSLTPEEKAGQLVQCNAGQFIANQLEITGPDGTAFIRRRREGDRR